MWFLLSLIFVVFALFYLVVVAAGVAGLLLAAYALWAFLWLVGHLLDALFDE